MVSNYTHLPFLPLIHLGRTIVHSYAQGTWLRGEWALKFNKLCSLAGGWVCLEGAPFLNLHKGIILGSRVCPDEHIQIYFILFHHRRVLCSSG